jgi:hypothetical protein
VESLTAEIGLLIYERKKSQIDVSSRYCAGKLFL